MDLSYRYGLGTSGLNYSPNITNINPSIIIPDSYNFNILNNSIKSRGGTEIIYDFKESTIITSIFQYKNDLFITTIDGKIFINDSLIYSGNNNIENATYIIWNDNVIISSGTNIPQVFIPESTSTIDYPEDKMAADWKIAGEYPEIMYLHGKGNSVRAWAIGRESYDNILYYSVTNQGESPLQQVPDFSEDTEKDNGFFYIDLRNDHRLRGMIDFGDKLILFSDLSAFVINNEETDTTLWGYEESQWKGGAFSHYAIVRVENDVFVFAKDGTIYSITAVVSYGDYRISSITESASINDYINEKFNLEETSRVHAIFDPTLRIIKFFLTKKHDYENTVALVYNVDRTPSNGWMLHNNELYDSGYNAACSALLLKEDNTYVIITGDYNGRIWELETKNTRDDHQYINFQLTTPWINAEDPRNTKLFIRGFIEMSNLSAINVTVTMRVEGKYSKTLDNLFFKGSNNTFDISRWDEAVFDGSVPREYIRYRMNRIGVDIQQIFSFKELISTTNDKFNIAKWDKDVFADKEAVFAPFYVLSNTLDFKPVAQRLTL